MENLRLKRMLKKHTQLQNQANMIKLKVKTMLLDYNPKSKLITHEGCCSLGVTDPEEFEQVAYNDLRYFLSDIKAEKVYKKLLDKLDVHGQKVLKKYLMDLKADNEFLTKENKELKEQIKTMQNEVVV